MNKILIFVVIVLLFVRCIDKKSNDLNQTSSLTEDSSIVKIKTNKNVTFLKDTLGFLSLKELIDYQKYEKLVIPEILKYALSSEIRIIRNEIFARKGYIFKDQFLTEYFNQKDWYEPSTSLIDSITLSKDEKLLLDTLVFYENRNKNYTKEKFKTELLLILENHDRRQNVPLTLWRQVVSEYPHSTNSGYAPWDYLGSAYTILYYDTIMGFHHCILEYYCGAEGGNCTSRTIYILDSDLKLIDVWTPDFYVSDIKKIKPGEYSYTKDICIDLEKDEWKEINENFYLVTKDGKISKE